MYRWDTSWRTSLSASWHLSQSTCNVGTPAELPDTLAKYTMGGLVGRIKCPAFVAKAERGHILEGAPEVVTKALGSCAMLVELTEEDGGTDAHRHVDASRVASAVMYDWFEVKVVAAHSMAD